MEKSGDLEHEGRRDKVLGRMLETPKPTKEKPANVQGPPSCPERLPSGGDARPEKPFSFGAGS